MPNRNCTATLLLRNKHNHINKTSNAIRTLSGLKLGLKVGLISLNTPLKDLSVCLCYAILDTYELLQERFEKWKMQKVCIEGNTSCTIQPLLLC